MVMVDYETTGIRVGRGVMAAGGFVTALGGLAVVVPALFGTTRLLVAGISIPTSICFALGGGLLALGAGIHRAALRHAVLRSLAAPPDKAHLTDRTPTPPEQEAARF